MTSKERVLRAARHQKTDRIPVDYCTRTDVRRRLTEYLGLKDEEELYQKLGIDVRRFGVKLSSPEFDARTNGVLGGNSEKSGARYVFHPDGSYEDMWGVSFRPSDDGLYDGWVDGPFAQDEDLDGFHWPDIANMESVPSIADRIAPYRDYAVMGTFNYPFKTCWMMRGLENYLCDTLVNQDFARALWERAAVYETEKALRFIRAGGDIVGFSGDIAMQNSMMVSPEAWRAIDKPLFAQMIRSFKRENPDILVYYHSDGNMEEVIPDMIEIGVDILNPIQPESMDVERIYTKYAHRIALHGTISIQQTLPHGTLADVRNEVRRRIALSDERGGMIIAPANHTQNDTPLENILEVYRAAGSYRE